MRVVPNGQSMSSQRYQVIGKIGQGGLGEVFLAQDTQLDREVALKRMKLPEDGNLAAISADLLREAKTLSALQHPNIVTVYDVGTDEKGPFVVLELLKGETLDAVIERGGMTLDDFKQVVTQTLEGLIAAQAVGLVHRDLKPGNIMVVWLASGKFQIKILDFGLAKFGLKARPQTEDQGGGIFGSIFFMAPEQFERFPLDARTDMYSLGCIYYQILSTKHPFDGETGVEVMASHLQHHVTPLKQTRPDLPDWLCHWVMWLISREMEDRPSDARSALEFFMAQRHGRKDVPPPPAVSSGTVRPPGSHRPMVIRPPGPGGAASQQIHTGGATMAQARSSVAQMTKLPRKKSNLGMILVLSILTAALIAGGGYLYYASTTAVEEPKLGSTLVQSPAVTETTPAPKTPDPAVPPTPQSPPIATTLTPPPLTPAPLTPAVAPVPPKSDYREAFLSGDVRKMRTAAAMLPPIGNEGLPNSRTNILQGIIAGASPAQRTQIHRYIGSSGTLDSSSLLRADLASPEKAIRIAAIQAVSAWAPKTSVAEALLKAAFLPEPQQAAAVYCRLVSMMGNNSMERLAMLRKVQPHAAEDPVVREALLQALSTIADPLAKHFAAEFKDDKTVASIQAALGKIKLGGQGDLPLSAADASIMGPANGTIYDPATRTICNWTNEETSVGWDIETKALTTLSVSLSMASAATEPASYRITLGVTTKPINILPTGSDTKFAPTAPVDFGLATPGIYRIIISPAELPKGASLMNLQGIIVRKK